MPLRLNLFCNGQISANDKYLGNFDKVNWGSGHIERDTFGIPIHSNLKPSPLSKTRRSQCKEQE